LGIFARLRCGGCGCGLIVGNTGLSGSVGFNSTDTQLWESAGFGVNSFIFLLIGLEIDLITLWRTLPAVLLWVRLSGGARSLRLSAVSCSTFDRPIPLRWRHVLFFGNIKGSFFYGAGAQLTNNACRPRAADCLSVFGTVVVSSAVRQFALVGKRLQLSLLGIVSRLKNTSPADHG